MGRLIDADEAYKVLTDNYHHRTEFQHEALKEALAQVPTVTEDEIVTMWATRILDEAKKYTEEMGVEDGATVD